MYTVEPLLTDTLYNRHLQTTDTGRSSQAEFNILIKKWLIIRYMAVEKKRLAIN